MKELNIQDHEVTEELEILKGKIDDTLRKILEKMGIFDKRSTDPEMPELLQGILGDVSIKELLLKVKKMVSFRMLLFFVYEKRENRLCVII